MLLAEMVKESADIIHEMQPTQDQMNEIGAEIFSHNYDLGGAPRGSGSNTASHP